MLRLQTPVEFAPARASITYDDTIMVLGSCFADNIGTWLRDLGFDVCANPFGTLYNPVSLAAAVERLASGTPFTAEECVQMGAGAGLVGSFSHHTLMARPTQEEFLDNANASLAEACAMWKKATKVIITLGTAWCWRHLESGKVVANCLKRPAAEFARELLSLQDALSQLKGILEAGEGKEFIFTVSPIRHLSDGAHANTISKSTLQLAVAALEGVEYFPAYEIMMDELRDYRFYAEDMAHPSGQAISYIRERFCDFCIPADVQERMRAREKGLRRSAHRPLR